MSVLTAVQAKQVAKFLTASCAKLPQQSNSLTHGQWLDVISRTSGFRDWNAMSARIDGKPVLDSNTARWPDAHWTFFGVARVLITGRSPVHQLVWSMNRETTRMQVAFELANKIQSHTECVPLNHLFQYSQPDTRLSDGSVAVQWMNRARGCPIVISSDDQRICIHLWWLSEHYQLPENLPVWARDGSSAHTVDFDGVGDIPLHNYEDNEPNDSLTHIFLKQLSGREQRRRRCVFVPQWSTSTDLPTPLLVEEGSASATPTDVISGSNLATLRDAAKTYNAGLGLSSIDEVTISERFEFAELTRNEDDYTEFSGIYEN